jgi:hypothetical protein
MVLAQASDGGVGKEAGGEVTSVWMRVLVGHPGEGNVWRKEKADK